MTQSRQIDKSLVALEGERVIFQNPSAKHIPVISFFPFALRARM
jgi:hypothetical protein